MPATVEPWRTAAEPPAAASEGVAPKPTRWWEVWWPPVAGLVLVLFLMEVAARNL